MDDCSLLNGLERSNVKMTMDISSLEASCGGRKQRFLLQCCEKIDVSPDFDGRLAWRACSASMSRLFVSLELQCGCFTNQQEHSGGHNPLLADSVKVWPVQICSALKTYRHADF